MVTALIIIGLATVLQNSFEMSINTKCHPNINKGIKCLHSETMSTSKSEERLRVRNLNVPQSYLRRTNDSSSTEDASVINSYEGIRKALEYLDNSKTIDKVKTEYLRNIDDQDDEIYDDSVKFERHDTQDKSDNEDVSYKRAESLRNFLKTTDISDSVSDFEGFEHLRKSHKDNPDSIKYNSYESIKNQLEKGKWILMPTRQSNLDKKILPGILYLIGSNVIAYGVGELFKKG